MNPSEMSVERDGRCWLRKAAEVSSQPYGPVAMRVERRADGYHVWLQSGGPVASAVPAVLVVEIHHD